MQICKDSETGGPAFQSFAHLHISTFAHKKSLIPVILVVTTCQLLSLAEILAFLQRVVRNSYTFAARRLTGGRFEV
jgi:hypothetical protein